MNAMKMDFICKDSPETDSRRAAPGPNCSNNDSSSAKAATVRALLNSSHDSDVDMETELLEEDADAAVATASTGANKTPVNGSTGRSDAAPPAKRVKASAAAVVGDDAPAHLTDEDISEKNGGLSDNEDSEDEQAEYAAWQDVDLNPAVDLVNKVVRECLEAGKTYNKSITAKTTQLLMGLDSVLLELKSLSDARDSSRTKTTRPGQDASCDCAIALGILPLVNRDAVAGSSDHSVKPTPAPAPAATSSNTSAKADPIAEDLTDRVLLKIEASVERLRELAEMIQATSMQGEANLVSKVTLPDGTLQSLSAAVHASAASATAAAIAQERGHLSSAFGRLFTPLQVQKLQTWYYLYPRPLTDELTLMRTILNYRPYANPFQATALTLAHIRDWFKRRRHRERMRFLKLALEAGRDPHAAEEEINLRLEQRVEHLRATVDLNDLVKEVDKVRAESPLYDSMVAAFARPSHVNAYVAASHALPVPGEHYGMSSVRTKRPRSQDADVEDAPIVKPATRVEVAALQRRLRSQLALARSATTTNALQHVVDVLRSMDVSPDVRIQTGLVADLKQILKTYRKPTLLRKSTIALLERIGMSRRPVAADAGAGEEAHGDVDSQQVALTGNGDVTDASVPPPPPNTLPLSSTMSPAHHHDDDAESMSGAVPPPPPPVSRRGKREKGRRPMKFSMQQVMALEGWFQQTYKPSQSEMETYLDALNAPPLRDAKKQLTDVSMTQLRRWFNKRRCLRRPPFALMTSSSSSTTATVTAPSKDGDDSVVNAPDAAVGADTDELEDDDDDDANDSDDNDSTGGNSSSDHSNRNDSSDNDNDDDDDDA